MKESNKRLNHAVDEYLNEIIDITAELQESRSKRRNDEEEIEEMKAQVKRLPLKKKVQIADRGVNFLDSEYKNGNISFMEHKTIQSDLKKYEKKIEESLELHAKKGTANRANQVNQRKEEPKKNNKKKKNLRKRAAAALLVVMVGIGGAATVQHHHNEQIRQEQQQAENKKIHELQNAREVLADREHGVTEIGKKALENLKYGNDEKSKGMELVNEVKYLFIKQYEEATGEKLSDISIIQDDFIQGRNKATGEVVNAGKDLTGYINKGFDTKQKNRYMIFKGSAYTEDKEYNGDNLIAACTEDGLIFTDSKPSIREGSEILAKMAKSRGAEYLTYNGNVYETDSMLDEAFEFNRYTNYPMNKYEAGNMISAFYSQYDKYCKENGVNMKQEYANDYITNSNGDIIACVTKEKEPEEELKIEEAIETIAKYKEQSKEIEVETFEVAKNDEGR